MALALFGGSILVAFSPLVALFAFVVLRRPEYVIISAGGSFFWLLATLLGASMWWVIGPLRHVWWFVVPAQVLAVESARLLFFMLYHRLSSRQPHAHAPAAPSTGPNAVASMPAPLPEAQQRHHQQQQQGSRLGSVVSIGGGFAVAHASVMMASVAWEGLVPGGGAGSLPCPACPAIPLVAIQAIATAAFSVLNVAWSVIMYDGVRKRSFVKLLFVLLSHMMASAATIFNTMSSEYLCYIGVGGVYATTLLVLVVAVVILRNNNHAAR